MNPIGLVGRAEGVAGSAGCQIFERLQIVVPEGDFVLWIWHTRERLTDLIVFQLVLGRRLPLVTERRRRRISAIVGNARLDFVGLVTDD